MRNKKFGMISGAAAVFGVVLSTAFVGAEQVDASTGCQHGTSGNSAWAICEPRGGVSDLFWVEVTCTTGLSTTTQVGNSEGAGNGNYSTANCPDRHGIQDVEVVVVAR